MGSQEGSPSRFEPDPNGGAPRLPTREDGRCPLSPSKPRGVPMPPAARPEPNGDPIGPFLHYLMAECGLSANTLAAYRSDVVRFSRWRKQHAPGPLADLRI